MKRPGRYLVVGSGSIGRRHLRNLRQLRPDGVLAVLRRPGSLALTVNLSVHLAGAAFGHWAVTEKLPSRATL